jgi:folate-dependent phosphoribosylglycinamide formyltransferase PurN
MHAWFALHAPWVEIGLVVNNFHHAPVWDLCAELGLACEFISTRDMAAFEHALILEIRQRNIRLIALAGFMKLLSAPFIRDCGIPIVNIHPALVPKHCGPGMYGMRVHEAVFDSREKLSGVTVHRVDPIYDHGEILCQTRVDVSDCADPREIATKVLAAEHATYAPTIVKLLES